MRKAFYLAVLAAFLVLDWSAGATVPARKKAASKKTSTTHKRTSSRTSASRTKTNSKRHSTSTWRNRQLTPTPERYKEIQDALVAKGFLSGEEANGVWGASSVEALKRFQAEQNIDATGKINSLSLIALGLGPKRDRVPQQPAASTDPRPQAFQER